MPEDASLDQFVSAEAADSDDEGDNSESGEAEPTNGEVDSEDAVVEPGDAVAESGGGAAEPETAVPESENAATDPEVAVTDPEDGGDSESTEETVEPAVSTYEWSPEGGECADCGDSAERLWRGDGQADGDLVCVDCKDW